MEYREKWVDYAKAIGIILVVYGHVARGLVSGGIDFSDVSYKLFDSVIYSFHMPLFFFLSGLFFYSSFHKKKGTKLIISKVDTIFYPYIIWSILQGGIEAFLSNYTNGSVSIIDVLSLLWAPRAQFWFLYALFTLFILSSVIYSFLSKSFTIPLLFFSIVLYLYPNVIPQGFLIEFITDNFVFFVLGITFSVYLSTEYFSSRATCFSLLILFILAQWFFHDYLLLNYTDKGVETLILASLSIAFVISISLLISRSNEKLFLKIGSSSMGIYLMHILAASGTRIILIKFFGVESVVLHVIIGCSVGIFVPIFALYIIDKFSIKYMFYAPISYITIKWYKKITT